MKSRTQFRTLTITAIVTLFLMFAGVLSTPVSTFAEGVGPIPPEPEPTSTDTLSYVPPGTTSTSTATAGITEPSLLDVVITVIDVIL